MTVGRRDETATSRGPNIGREPMHLRYEEDLIESTVFLCANGRRADLPALQVRRFHREREKLYAILDPDERNAAFFRLHLEWFREWGLENMLTDLLREFPLLPGALNVLAFRKARGKNEEGAELYVSAETGRNGVVALQPERFGNDDSLCCLLRHELTHLQDMIDPAFGYSPHLHLPGQTAAQQRLTRERYRLLWDITIDGRLTNSGRGTVGTREQHRASFERAFNFLPEIKRADLFAKLWSGHLAQHGQILALASDPRELHGVHQPIPGAPCPLCGFATFRWADPSRLTEQAAAAIRAEFPVWKVEEGLCARCLEMFDLACRLHASTVVV